MIPLDENILSNSFLKSNGQNGFQKEMFLKLLCQIESIFSSIICMWGYSLVQNELFVYTYLTWSSGCIMIFCVWSNCLEEANILASSMDSANSLLWRVFCLLFNNIIKVTIDTHRTCKKYQQEEYKTVSGLCPCAVFLCSLSPRLSVPRLEFPDWTLPLISRI